MSIRKDRWAKYKAEMYLYSTEDGGLHFPMRSGFRTDVEYKNQARISSITFEKDEVAPGSSESVVIHLWLHTDDEVNYFLEADKCKLMEASAIGALSNFKLIEDKLFEEEDE